MINWVDRTDDLSWLPVEGDDGWVRVAPPPPVASSRRSGPPMSRSSSPTPMRWKREGRGRVRNPRRYLLPGPLVYQGKCPEGFGDHAALDTDRERVDAALAARLRGDVRLSRVRSGDAKPRRRWLRESSHSPPTTVTILVSRSIRTSPTSTLPASPVIASTQRPQLIPHGVGMIMRPPRELRLPGAAKRRRRRLLPTTNTDDNPMAPAAIIGLSTPKAASGIVAAL